MKNKEEVLSLIRDLLNKINIPVEEINTEEDPNSGTWFLVSTKEPNYFFDKNGEAIQALNHLVRRIIEGKNSEISKELETNNILIDINGFQKKKIENIKAIAHMMGERARYFKSNIEIDPMSSFERRIVHEFFSDSIDLKTESIGFGPKRRVIIKYIGEI